MIMTSSAIQEIRYFFQRTVLLPYNFGGGVVTTY